MSNQTEETMLDALRAPKTEVCERLIARDALTGNQSSDQLGR